MATIELEYATPSMSPWAWAEYISTIKPIYGAVAPQTELVDTLRQFRSRWQKRLAELRVAGWHEVQSRRFGYAWNCPPCCVRVTPALQTCRLRICPFCHARRVAALAARMSKVPIERVLSFRILHGHEPKSPDRIFYGLTQNLTSSFSNLVLPRHARARNKFRVKHLKKAAGGFYWYTLAPHVFNNPAADTAIGLWYSQHSCVALMPKDWEMSEVLRKYSDVRNPATAYDLAWLIGRAFLYRKQWLTAPAVLVAQMLNKLKNKRLRTGFGCFRKRKS